MGRDLADGELIGWLATTDLEERNGRCAVFPIRDLAMGLAASISCLLMAIGAQ